MRAYLPVESFRQVPDDWEGSSLCRLARAARQAVRDGLDGELALSLVLFPTEEILAALELQPPFVGPVPRPWRLDAGAHEWLAVWDARRAKRLSEREAA